MKKNKKTTVAQAILASLTLAIGSQAIAQQATPDAVFAAYTANPEGFNRVVMTGKVIEIGERSKNSTHTKNIQGFANDLPLITVLKQLTPNGWIVKKNDSKFNQLDINQLISWSGGKNWIDTFSDIAAKYNLDFNIDWNNNNITVSNSQTIITPKPPKKVAVFELAGNSEVKVSETTTDTVTTVESTTEVVTTGSQNIEIVNSQSTSANTSKNNFENSPIKITEEKVEAIKVEVAPIIEWHMIASKTLKENVEAWASTTNYDVRWTGKDYPVDNRVFQGTFDEVGGPIHQLSIDYGFDPNTGEPLVDYPLAFQLFQNGILLVEDATFEQPSR